ncbi:sugar kinase [Ahrensia sp. R2A130]|uniref:sugar kinase n=1 Tax=Ahrensia sp. R2A130 TaxID=744979 RepID=UPI0001E0C357|nr:sugar kinase [Ahrensia sp. R2A130]EFL89371.1 2-dehydro-3-deoxygluconokinase [Ahrensia sp. R2A130]
MLDCLAIGEVMAELRRDVNGDFSVGFAGDTFNTAVYCRRALGASGSVAYMTRLGLDPLSYSAEALARSEDLNTEFIERTEQAQIGIYSVATDDQGERSFSYWRDRSAARGLFADASSHVLLPKARIVYLSGITLAIMPSDARQRLMDALEGLSKSGSALVAFDSNYRPALWEDVETARAVMRHMWDIADIALPSLDDELALFGESDEAAVFERFSRGSWTACAIKRGEKGPVSPNLNSDALPEFRPASKVHDTTAAGDSFNGGYLAAFLRGEGEATCLLAGHDLASQVVQYPGAIVCADAIAKG